jgi:uncharacterized cupin superfamily protein
MEKFKIHTLINRDAPNFLMTALELHDYFDFEVKRVYFIVDPKTGISGEHCHYAEKEFFVLIQGTATAIIDQGNGKEEIPMEGHKTALYVANYVWHGFKDFSEDAILLALSSTNYNPDRSDYLEDYDKYLEIRDEHLKSE